MASEAEVQKRRGNELLAAGKASEAAEAYSLAIEADPIAFTLWSNRSAALLKAKDAAGALRDADETARLAPSWPKAQLRRAKALEALGRFSDAVEACGLGEVAAAAAVSEAEVREFRRLRATFTARLGTAPQDGGRGQAVLRAGSTFSAHAMQGGALAALFDGVLSVERGEGWARPWRLPHQGRDLYDEALSAQAACAAVRMVFRTAGRQLRISASVAVPGGVDVATLQRNGGYPLEYELFVDGRFFGCQQLGASEGAHVASFEGLPEGEKELEVWLPPAVALDVHAVDSGDTLTRPPADSRPTWVCYGSSICHGGPTQASPSCTWPCTCSRLADVRLMNLGFAGQCFLDLCVARAIRETPCDCISMKVGINIQCLGALTSRTFSSALVGFVQLVREGHPTTPIILISPIWHGPLEEKAPVGRPEFMTLVQLREKIRSVVETFRRLGDEHIFYRDGLELLGQAEEELLYDGLHPGAEGHSCMGQRFAKLEFGTAGRLLPGRLDTKPADVSAASSPPTRQDLQGAYLCEVPGSGRCRMVVADIGGNGLACKSDRPDWPASALHVRGDLVFLRSSPGVWGRVEGRGAAVIFSNGIRWTKVAAPQSPP